MKEEKKSYYQKINTIFQRDLNPESPTYNLIQPDKPYTSPEFEVLKDCKWECTEKIDGTNISIHIIPELNVKEEVVIRTEFHGKTSKAVIPNHLLRKLEEIFTFDTIRGILPEEPEDFTDPVILFGEGYGTKIQGDGGKYISDGVDFILFDVKVGNRWLERESCEDIANKLGIQIVPHVGNYTISEAINIVKKGFKSYISEDRDLDAEGLVLRAPLGLLTQGHERIITKLKTCDFRKLEAANKRANEK